MRSRLVILTAALVLANPVTATAYTVGEPSEALRNSSEQWAREGAEQQARENAEKKQKEEQEHQATEAQTRQTQEAVAREELEHHQQAERQAREAQELAAKRQAEEAAAIRCAVPVLKNDSLKVARKALTSAHCKLGHVSVRHGQHGSLVVATQTPAHGRTLAKGASVDVTMTARKQPNHGHR